MLLLYIIAVFFSALNSGNDIKPYIPAWEAWASCTCKEQKLLNMWYVLCMKHRAVWWSSLNYLTLLPYCSHLTSIIVTFFFHFIYLFRKIGVLHCLYSLNLWESTVCMCIQFNEYVFVYSNLAFFFFVFFSLCAVTASWKMLCYFRLDICAKMFGRIRSLFLVSRKRNENSSNGEEKFLIPNFNDGRYLAWPA